MTTNPWFAIPATIVLIVLSAFFVVIEFSLMAARRHRLEEEAATSRAARAALRGVNELTIMLAGAQLGITLCTFALGAITKPAVDAWLGPLLTGIGVPGAVAGTVSFVLSLLFVTFLHLVVGEMAPKSWAIAHPETAAKLIGVPSRAYVAVVRPLLTFTNDMANRLVRATGVQPVDQAAVGGQTSETIRHLVDHSTEAGTLEDRHSLQLTSVLELERLTVRDVLTGEGPVWLPADAPGSAVQRLAVSSGHQRILVALDDGASPQVVHVRDTLLEPPDRPIGDLARPVLVLAADTPVYEALGRMREAGEQLALVGDGSQDTTPSGYLGVVSLPDLVGKLLPAVEAARA